MLNFPFHKKMITYTKNLAPHTFPGPNFPPLFPCFLIQLVVIALLGSKSSFFGGTEDTI